MKKYAFLLLTVFFTLALCQRAFPQTGTAKPDPAPNRLATVDLAAVFALHPMMRYHDEKTGLFIKPFNKNDGAGEIEKAIEGRRNAYEKLKAAAAPEIKRLKAEMTRISSEYIALGGKRNAESAAISDRFEREIGGAASEEAKKLLLAKRTAALAEVQNDYVRQLQAQRFKYDEMKASLDKVYNSIASAYFMSPAETEDMFRHISAEVKEAIDFAAAQKGVLSVFNVSRLKNESFQVPHPAPFEAAKLQPGAPGAKEVEAMLDSGPDYTKVINFVRPPAFKSAPADSEEIKYEAEREKMFKDSENSAYKTAYENRFKIIPMKTLSRIMNASIVYGGCDITAPAVAYIYKKNGLSKEKSEAACGVLDVTEDLDE